MGFPTIKLILIVIEGFTIRQDAEGRYCLNDLHKAAGGLDKHYPAQWLRYDNVQDLIKSLTVGKSTIKPIVSITNGELEAT